MTRIKRDWCSVTENNINECDIGIYFILNTINSKIYIGQSKNILQRWKRHKKEYRYRKSKLYSAIKKYGFDNFTFGILYNCSIDELNKWEKYFIIIFNSMKEGYNLTPGGDSYKMSTETKQKISESKKGKQASLDTRRKMSETKKGERHPRYGTTHTKHTLDKIKTTIKENYLNGYVSPTNKKIKYLGVEYPSLIQLSKYLNLTRTQLSRRIRNNKIKVEFLC